MSKGKSGRSKNDGDRRSRGGGGGAAYMKQMGFTMPNMDLNTNDDDLPDDNDDDLEAELRQIMGEGQTTKRARGGAGPKQPQDLNAFHMDVSKLLANIDKPINDEDLSDDDDPDVLAELNEIAGELADVEDRNNLQQQQHKPSTGNILSLLEERKQMYEKAVTNAKNNNDATRSRRFERQLKTIQELLQSARTGAPINENDIPPEVIISPPTSSMPSTPKTESSVNNVTLRTPQPPQLQENERRQLPPPRQQQPVITANVPVRVDVQQPHAHSSHSSSVTNVSSTNNNAIERLKELAIQAKRAGDVEKAKQYLREMKSLQGETAQPPKRTSISVPSPPPQQQQQQTNENENEGEAMEVPLKAPEPKTVLEALQQRHGELNKRGEEAATNGDRAKARRMERLSKQYEEAIEATKRGKPYDYNELADLPGFAPIPVNAAGTHHPSSAAPPAASTLPLRKPNPAGASSHPPPASVAPHAAQGRPTVNPAAARQSQHNNIAQTLRAKQEHFQKLALEAKRQGDIESAKNFLKSYKGLEQMVAAAESGLPVDLTQVPKLPDDNDYEMLDDDEELLHSDRDTIYRRLQEDLLHQIQLCARNQQVYSQMDNHEQSIEYKQLEQRCQQDLERLRKCFQHGLKAPLFHYERRQMNIVQINTDLGENDLEVTVIRGINYPLPQGYTDKTLETYVHVEFPYPPETSQQGKTKRVYGAQISEYHEILRFYIKRNDAKFKRLMNRKELKLVVYYRSGFMKMTEKVLGTSSIKLQPLEDNCTIHESVDLYEHEHKKRIEGKIECKIRIREALGQAKASEVLPQRWLVIDRFEEIPPSKMHSKSAGPITTLAKLVPTAEAYGTLALALGEEHNNNDDRYENNLK
ncbi:unnamed protein product [Didymodactylos carnosus]|uniref:C2 domain-containing protein n=1 Tax=Didymodactylos carnosus TaxID=1234261 RepID=A0A8S2KKI0_9BILA|nr:unnamed protein product [Didymodactylos carnosus]CAF3856323.1 unnamed protein product [Didymodactylos carnosus]